MSMTDSHLEAAYEERFELDPDEVLDAWFDTDDVDFDDEQEPDLDFMFETDSAFESIGWGDDDAYGGGDWA